MKRKTTRIDHRSIKEAIKNFEANGGIIHKLPAQEHIDRPMIGKEKHLNYESLASVLSL